MALAFSGGKDSVYTAWILFSQGFDLILFTVQPESDGSWIFHYPNSTYTWLQSEALGLPWIRCRSSVGEEEELKALRSILEEAIRVWGVEALASGVVYSWYQMRIFQLVSDEFGLKLYTPLWGKDPLRLLSEEIESGMEIIVTGVAAEGLDESWLGAKLDYDAVERLEKLRFRYGLSPIGEGGEMETFVTDAPFFRYRIRIVDSRKMWKGISGYLNIEEAILQPKLL
ncbi:MAG: diphthine--ammonia ligase [Nitrososphaerota archaeon]|nr:diphthine--ammonia ligase [Candidatus Bathyarchaeota archaeon]MCX8162598.1 diphthine--ammonia ligase [Candidatus Bathyarchaeota archaeon]MDW8062186.1 diphthine--ammonia ligase [Nitrososphaerota archaeon]